MRDNNKIVFTVTLCVVLFSCTCDNPESIEMLPIEGKVLNADGEPLSGIVVIASTAPLFVEGGPITLTYQFIADSSSCDTTDLTGYFTIENGVAAYRDRHCGGLPGIGPGSYTNFTIGGNNFAIAINTADTLIMLVKPDTIYFGVDWIYEFDKVDSTIELMSQVEYGRYETLPTPYPIPDIILDEEN